MPHCFAYGCTNNSSRKPDGVVFHTFPYNEEAVQCWIVNSGREVGNLESCAKEVLEDRQGKRYRMCSKHFTEDCYERDMMSEMLGLPPKKKLKNDAVPTIFYDPHPNKQRKSKAGPCVEKKQEYISQDLERDSLLTSVNIDFQVSESKSEEKKPEINQTMKDTAILTAQSFLNEGNIAESYSADPPAESRLLQLAKLSAFLSRATDITSTSSNTNCTTIASSMFNSMPLLVGAPAFTSVQSLTTNSQMPDTVTSVHSALTNAVSANGRSTQVFTEQTSPMSALANRSANKELISSGLDHIYSSPTCINLKAISDGGLESPNLVSTSISTLTPLVCSVVSDKDMMGRKQEKGVKSESKNTGHKSEFTKLLDIAEVEKLIKKEPVDIHDDDLVSTEIEVAKSETSLNDDKTNSKFMHNFGGIIFQPSPTLPVVPPQLPPPVVKATPMSVTGVSPITLLVPIKANLPAATITSSDSNFPVATATLQQNVSSTEQNNQKTAASTTFAITSTASKGFMKLLDKKNPIPRHLPSVLPEELKNSMPLACYVCKECGDVFHFHSTLDAHLNRRSMQIIYKCEVCWFKLIFYNKCALQSHLRSHSTPKLIHPCKVENISISPLPGDILVSLDVMGAEKETVEKKNKVIDQSGSKHMKECECLECGFVFSDSKMLSEHFGFSDKTCSFTNYCALCHLYLPRPCSLSAHRRVHHEKRPFVCPECGLAILGNSTVFTNHLKYKCFHFSRTSFFVCPKCSLSFDYTKELKDHMIQQHSETFIKCSGCPMAFKTLTAFQSHHDAVHHGKVLLEQKEIFKCPLCDTVFQGNQQLINHMDMHIADIKKDVHYYYKCIQCERIFEDKCLLSSHLHTVHHISCHQFMCDQCGHLCKTDGQLKKHTSSEHKKVLRILPKILHNCAVCDISFKNECFLQAHTMKIHSLKLQESVCQDNPGYKYKCCFCRSIYKSNTHHNQHVITHRNYGVPVCLICMSFCAQTMEELANHEQLCSESKDKCVANGQCSKCHKLFMRSDMLIKHMKLEHQQESQYPCHLCGLLYTSSQSLREHINIIHERKQPVYPCYACKERKIKRYFSTRKLLQKHLMCKHRLPKSQIDWSRMNCALPDDSDSFKDTANAQHGKTPKEMNRNPLKKLKTAEEHTYSCAKCTFTSEDSESFQQHITSHKVEEDSVQCSECGLCFAALASLKMHLFMVHKIKDTAQFLSLQGFYTMEFDDPGVSNCATTKQTKPAPKLELFECTVCYKTFINEIALKTHMRTHGMAFIKSKRMSIPNSV